MSRPLDSANVTEITAERLAPATFVFLDFQSGPVRVWDGIGSMTWGGNTYVGLGYLGAISAIEETTSVQPNGVIFGLNGVPNALIATVLGDNYNRRAAKVWLGMLNSSDQLVADPDLAFSGRMNNVDFDKGAETAVIRVHAESRLVDLRRTRELRYTHEHQQIHAPGDDFFKYMVRAQSTPLMWGSQRVETYAGGGGSDNGDNGGEGQQ